MIVNLGERRFSKQMMQFVRTLRSRNLSDADIAFLILTSDLPKLPKVDGLSDALALKSLMASTK